MTPETPRRASRGTGREHTKSAGDLTGITELFGLRDGADSSEAATGPSAQHAPTVSFVRWMATTMGSPDAAAAAGRMVRDRYRLIAQLGAGGMGVTYRAWDTQAGVPVVVKMPKWEVWRDREMMARFGREIEAMRAVLHESIVPITDSGVDEGCPFVAMRFLPGGSLAEYRRRDDEGNAIRNPPGMLHFWLRGVAAALDHIHSKGMLHRDVKPGNVFLDGFLRPFLGDFGIAKVVDESGGLAKEQTLTATMMAVGTPEYMAPELFKPRSRPDGRVDQYALAVTVYEMLCGEKPFSGSTSHIIVEHSSTPVPPLERRCPGLPQTACEAVHRALAKEPAERFASCGDFAAAVLAELPRLASEADTVRLLCPACKNILKLPREAAGRSGRCPRCRSTIDVAANLESLWLESEERGGGPAATEDWTADGAGASPGQPDRAAPTGSRSPDAGAASRRLSWTTAAMAAAFAGLVVGLLIGLAIPRPPQYIVTGTTGFSPASPQRAASGESDAVARPDSGELPPEAIRVLANGQGDALQLENLRSLSVPAAKALANYRGYQLSLDGLETLSADAATALAAYRGRLSLKGVKRLSPEAEAALATYQGELVLEGLRSLRSVDLATKLGKSPSWMNFPELSDIAPETARALVTQRHYGYYRGVSIGGLRQPDAELLSALAKGYVALDGIKTLDESAAAALAEDDAESRLWLGSLEELSPGAAAELAKRRGSLTLGLKTLSTDAARALAAGTARLRLPALTSCPPAGLRSLKAMPGLLVIPPALHTPLERFLWCLKGWAAYVVLALLAAVVVLLPAGVLLVRRIATDQQASITSVYGDRMKRALLPSIIATSVLVGVITFLGLKVLPAHWKYWDDLGEAVPLGIYRGLDLLFCGLVAATIGSFAYAWFVRHRLKERLKESTQPLWAMRVHVGTAQRISTLVICGAWLVVVCIGAANSLGFFDHGYRYRPATGLFVLWLGDALVRGGWLLLPLLASTPLVLQSARRALRPELAECLAYHEGIVSDAGVFFPWDRLYGYSWKPDHLELTMPHDKKMRAALEKNHHGFKFGMTARFIVPPHQRDMVEAFLAERLAAANAAAKS